MKIAIITGASSGIGKTFCQQLDSEGFDEIWGVALEKDKLNETKKMLKTKFVSFPMDLTDESNLAKFKAVLEEKKPTVSWLVNCSGFGKFGRYDEVGVETNCNMIDLNCKALVYMTETVLPFICEGGKIVQIASVAGFQPIPYISVYGATKAFVISYSRALNVELKSRKISVCCVCPFWTKTAFFDRAKQIKSKTDNEVVSKYIVMYDPQKVVAKAIKDAKKQKDLSIYGFIARSQTRLVKMLPAKATMKIWMKQQKLDKKYKDK